MEAVVGDAAEGSRGAVLEEEDGGALAAVVAGVALHVGGELDHLAIEPAHEVDDVAPAVEVGIDVDAHGLADAALVDGRLQGAGVGGGAIVEVDAERLAAGAPGIDHLVGDGQVVGVHVVLAVAPGEGFFGEDVFARLEAPDDRGWAQALVATSTQSISSLASISSRSRYQGTS